MLYNTFIITILKFTCFEQLCAHHHQKVKLSGVQVEKFLLNLHTEFLNLHTGRSLTVVSLIQFDLLMMSIEFLEACKFEDYYTSIKVLYNVILHQVGQLPRVVPGCTVS